MARYSPLLEAQLKRVQTMGTATGLNAIAFSGGVDSSLVAWLVYQVFGEEAIACLGISAALPAEQRSLAQEVAAVIGLTFTEIETQEGEEAGYVANAGQACFYCKTTLYSTLDTLCQSMLLRFEGQGDVVLFNGTNLDDRADETRVGLKAANNFNVMSPLDNLTKDQVRTLAREVGLPNWNYAASPCLRSRLQYGVEATPARLQRVERAESVVRHFLALSPSDNMRVRTLTGEVAMIEVDAAHLDTGQRMLPALKTSLTAMGFDAVDLRAFRSGSLSRPSASLV